MFLLAAQLNSDSRNGPEIFSELPLPKTRLLVKGLASCSVVASYVATSLQNPSSAGLAMRAATLRSVGHATLIAALAPLLLLEEAPLPPNLQPALRGRGRPLSLPN